MRSSMMRWPRAIVVLAVSCLLVIVAACTVVATPSTSSTAPIGTSSGGASGGTPTVNGSVPLSHRLVIFANSALYALDTSNGNVLWKMMVSSFSQPVFANGQVYLMTLPGPNSGSQIVDIDAMSGTQRWAYSFPSGQQNAPATGSLVVSGHVVVAAITNQGLMGLNADTGKQVWNVALNLTMNPQPLAANKDTAFVVLPNGNLDAFNVATGQLRWEQNKGYSSVESTEQGIYATYSCGSSNVILASSSNVCLVELASSSGATQWNTQVTSIQCALVFICGEAPNPPVPGGNAVYVLFTNYISQGNNIDEFQDQRIDALNANGGGLIWQYVIPGTYGKASTNVTNSGAAEFKLEGADSTAAYMQDASGTITALSASNHAVLWKFANPNGKSDQFILNQGAIYLVNGSTVTAINTQNGSQLWSMTLPPPF
jgi:outer membrane protein assembly factor BamB